MSSFVEDVMRTLLVGNEHVNNYLNRVEIHPREMKT